ncbi:TPA: HNH endonuclease [Escherichia coli]|nr:HNH endonuclease [Escherichia coli]
MDLNNIFSYQNGELFWKIRPAKQISIGSKAGAPNKRGYILIGYKGKLYRRSRLVWELHKGPIPEGHQIDHINHCTWDDRIENLRLVLPSDNSKNLSRAINNSTGVTGVYFNKKACKFQAYIQINGLKKYLGLYDTIEDAKQARKQAEEHYKFHANHGLDA